MIPTSTNVKIDVKAKVPTGADAIGVFIHKETKSNDPDVAQLNEPARTLLNDLLDGKLVSGKSNEASAHLLDASAGTRLMVVGLGARAKLSCECLREGAAALVRAARKQKLSRVALIFPEVPQKLPGMPGKFPTLSGVEAGAEAIASGLALSSFDWAEYRGSASRQNHEKSAAITFTIVAPDSVRRAVERARIISDGQNFARTIASRPGNEINPPALADVAKELAREVGLKCRVLDEKEMKKLGMGGILAVGAGSNRTPPRMIVLEYVAATPASPRSHPKATRASPLLVVGKAITFDTGGISIKPAEKMGRMVFDKCGAMAVLGLMYCVAKLKLPVQVVGILSSAENHISETAYRPGDLLKLYNGVTVEVTNTDAEGRLVLGDALAWGIETYKPRAVVDLATLTGGCVVALGHIWAGLMSNDDDLANEIARHADNSGEKVWRLPIDDDVRDLLKSDFADIVNSAGRWGSPLTGGAFLSYFIPGTINEKQKKVPWVHLDIAGVAETEKDLPVYAKGATGFGVRTLVEWVSRAAT